MKKIKIGFIGFRTIPHSYGGNEAFIRELAPRLAEFCDSEVIVYCRKIHEPKGNISNYHRKVRKIFIPAIKHKFLETFIHSFLSTLHGIFVERVDIQYFHTLPSAPFCVLSRIFKINSVVNVDGIEWKRDKWGVIGKAYLRLSAFIAVKFAHVIVSDATEIKRLYLSKFKRDSVMIAYGAEIKYSKNPDSIKVFDIKRDGYYLIACRLVPENNIDLIIKAFNKVNTHRKLVIAGGVNYKSKYLEYCVSIAGDNVKFIGHIDDQELLNELHCNCYCYLHGHSVGGTNPSLLRALACGNCVLALNTPYNSEVLNGGEYGLLFKKSVNDCCQKLSSVDKDVNLRNKFSKKARRRILEMYTWEKITEQYHRLFKDIYLKKFASF